MTDTHHATLEGQEAPPHFRSDRPMWAPVWAMVVVSAALVIVPIALMVLLPTRAEGTIGVYERVTLSAQSGDREATAQFIAPEGWIRATDRGDTTALVATDPDGGTTLRVSVFPDVTSGPDLLRETSPVGALVVPVLPVELEGALTGNSIQYDLSAGDAVTRTIVACTATKPADCLLLTLSFQPGQSSHDIPPAALDLLNSAEVS